MRLKDLGVNTNQVFTFNEASIKKIITKLLEEDGYDVKKITIKVSTQERGDQRDSYNVAVFGGIEAEVCKNA